MLYRMVTEKLPFDAGDDMESLLRVQKAEFTPPEQVKPTVGPGVAGIINRALRFLPKERYQTADEMLADVERVLRTEFHSAGTDGAEAVAGAARPPRRRADDREAARRYERRRQGQDGDRADGGHVVRARRRRQGSGNGADRALVAAARGG